MELVATLAHDEVGLGEGIHADGAGGFHDGFRCGWLGSGGLSDRGAVVPHGFLHDTSKFALFLLLEALLEVLLSEALSPVL